MTIGAPTAPGSELPADTPLVVQVAEQFRADLAAAEDVQRALMARRWLQVEGALSDEIERLAAEAYNQGRALRDWEVFQLTRYQTLSARVHRELGHYLGEVEGIVDRGSGAQVRRGARDAQTLTHLTAREFGSSVRVSLMALNPAAVENVVALARAGQPLADLMQLAYGRAAEGMVDELIQGIALGRHPRETARRMRLDGLSRGFSHTELVARDIHNRSYRMASQQQYQQSGLVTRFIRLAAKNDRTCLACLALDGEVYAVDTLMELHPQDRCTMLPWVEGLPRLTFQTGRDWFEALPRERQRAIMGPTRHEAWLAGRFEFRDLATRRDNAVWGPSAVVTPVGTLLSRSSGT